MKKVTRRKFLRDAVVAGAAATAFPTLFIPKARAAWARKTLVHPNVDNLRVVGLTDPSMIRAVEPSASWARQEELVVRQAVWDSMDKLAVALAEIPNPDPAWRTIFVKPPAKAWSDTVVAIKINNIAQQHTHSAILSKVCTTMVQLGVRTHNIHIYDACHGGNMGRKTPFYGLPEGCRLEGRWGGSSIPVPVPSPWRAGSDSRCLKHLANGTVDILVNIAMCKGHSDRFGGFTMTMKNHFGTFSPRPAHQPGGSEYLLAINQTPEILGAMDPRTGRVLYPRQQLCIVDALWTSKHGPGGNPSHQTTFLAMGVFSPVVDYVVATSFRGKKMGWEPNTAAERMVTEFGYAPSDIPGGGTLVEV
jgi:hypothetical protein